LGDLHGADTRTLIPEPKTPPDLLRAAFWLWAGKAVPVAEDYLLPVSDLQGSS
jgi:hypothetical protein